MKKFKFGSITLGVCAVVIAMILAACPSPSTDKGGTTFTGVIYDDGFTSILANPQIWNIDETGQTETDKTRGFVAAADTTVKKNGTESFKISWDNVPNDQWMGLRVNVGNGDTISGSVNLSAYNVLTFLAKAKDSNVIIDKIGLAADGIAQLPNGDKFETYLEQVTIKSAEWEKIIIPLPNAAKLIAVNSVFYIRDSVTASAPGGTIYLDDIKFENISTIQVEQLNYTGTSLTVDIGNSVSIEKLTAKFKNGNTVIDNLGFTNLAAYATYTSSNEEMATVDADGSVTGVTLGSVMITAELGGQSVVIAVKVQDSTAFNGILYDDDLQNDFVAKVNPGGTEKDAEIDTVTFAGASGSSIKIDLTGSVGWAGGYVQLVNGINASAYNSLSFDINMSDLLANSVDYLELKIEDTDSTQDSGYYTTNLFDLTESDSVGDWKTYTVYSFTTNMIDFGKFKTLGLWNPKTGGKEGTLTLGTYYIDNIKFGTILPTKDSVDNRYYFIGDAMGVGTPEIEASGLTHFPGYDGSITGSYESSDGADGTDGYYKLTGTGSQVWAAGGWGDGPYIDFTGYESLVLWAKAPTNPSSGKIAATKLKIVLNSRHRSDTANTIGAPTFVMPSENTDFTNTWTKIEIPLSYFNTEPNFMQDAINLIKYELDGENHELYIDEMYLKAGSNSPALSVSGADFSKDIDESPTVDTVLGNLIKQVTYTAGAELSFAITEQNVTGAMSVDTATGVLKVADNTEILYASNPQLTATVQVSANNGTTSVNANIAVTININNPASKPTDAPNAPTANADTVINLFSDTYSGASTATQINVTNWDPNWNQATDYSEETIASNTVKKYSNLNHQGIEFTSVDVSGKTMVHFDMWTADETSFQFILISPASPNAHEASYSVPDIQLNQWNAYDVPLTTFTAGNASLELDNLFQIKIVGSGGKTVYLDNIYFYGSTAGATYTVAYDANTPAGGTVTGGLSRTEDNDVNHGDTIQSAPDGISVAGYTLGGWDTAADGSGTPFEFGTTQVTGAITLYAQWIKDFSNVIYNGGVDGGFVIDTDSAKGKTQVTISDPVNVDNQDALQVTLSAALEAGDWAGVYFKRSSGADVHGKSLKFSILASSFDANTTALEIKLEDGQGRSKSIDLFDTNWQKSTNGLWLDHEISIPDMLALSNQNNFNDHDLTAIGFWNPRTGNDLNTDRTMFIINNIRFEN